MYYNYIISYNVIVLFNVLLDSVKNGNQLIRLSEGVMEKPRAQSLVQGICQHTRTLPYPACVVAIGGHFPCYKTKKCPYVPIKEQQ